MRRNKIVLTGGGSGGHIFPLVAVASELRALDPDLNIFYLGDKDSYLNELADLEIKFVSIISSKIRRYFSLLNIIEIPKFFCGLLQAIIKMFFIMPDLVFSKGGPGSLPVVLAARFYFIPVIIHESDVVPSLTTKIASKFAKKIEVSFEETLNYLNDNSNIALTGNPIRPVLFERVISKEEARSRLGFSEELPLLFVIGGSQGSERLNNFIFSNLEELLKSFQIYHQVGLNNLNEAQSVLENLGKEISSFYFSRYKMKGFLNLEEMRLGFYASDVVIARAGAGTIFEIAAFGKPSILVPLPESAQDHQRLNAYAYVRNGTGIVLEEDNLQPKLFLLELNKIISNPSVYSNMSANALNFSKKYAAKYIAEDLLNFIKSRK